MDVCLYRVFVTFDLIFNIEVIRLPLVSVSSLILYSSLYHSLAGEVTNLKVKSKVTHRCSSETMHCSKERYGSKFTGLKSASQNGQMGKCSKRRCQLLEASISAFQLRRCNTDQTLQDAFHYPVN